MQPLIAILLDIAASGMSGSAQKAKRNTALYAALGLVGLSAYFFALLSATVYLANIMGLFEAALILCFGFIALALMIIVGIMISNNIKSKRQTAVSLKHGKTSDSDQIANLVFSVASRLGPARIMALIAVVTALDQIFKSKSAHK